MSILSLNPKTKFWGFLYIVVGILFLKNAKMNGKFVLALLLLLGISCKKQDSVNTTKILTTYESELDKVLDSNIVHSKKIHYLNGQLERTESLGPAARIKFLRPLSKAYLKLGQPKRFRLLNDKITNEALASNRRFELAQAYFDLGKYFTKINNWTVLLFFMISLLKF